MAASLVPVDRVWLRTPRLALCRPTEDDVDAIFEIHSDPRTYEHALHRRMREREEATVRFEEWERSWVEYGFGYTSVVVDEVVAGFCGVQPQQVSVAIC